MADDIPFDKDLDLTPGQVDQAMPGVRRNSLQQPVAVHLQGHCELHRRRGQSRDRRSRPGRSGAHRGAARCGARRDRDAYLRHPHPSRPFAGGAGDQGRDWRAWCWRRGRTAPRARSMSAKRRGSNASDDTDFRPDRALEDGEIVSGAGWTIEAVDDARPHREPHGLRVQGSQRAVLRRPRDGVVDADRGAAGRLDERLHGFAHKLARAQRADLFPGPRRRGRATRRASSRPTSCIASAREAVDPAPARKGRDRHPDAGARDLYRPRSAADRRGRHVGARASGGPGGARRGRDRRRRRRSTASIASAG